MIIIPTIDRYTADFAQLTHEPLIITAHMIAPVYDDKINFDGILAKALIHAALGVGDLPDTEDPYWLPLPLRMLWQDARGLPLWAASVLLPVGAAPRDTKYIHKRADDPLIACGKRRPTTRNGRYMSRSIPVATQFPREMQSYCIGNARVIRAMLDTLMPAIGKHRARGLGAISHWTIAQADFDERATYEQDGRLVKAVPEYSVFPTPLATRAVPVGWTPPHWKPSLHLPGYRVGTRTEAMPEFDAFGGMEQLMRMYQWAGGKA